MIAIGSDHAGYELKEKLKNYFKSSLLLKDFGTNSFNSCDYPLIAEKVSKAISSGECKKGILICGTGIGISIAANKINGIRAALCYNTELAEMARRHNNANIICIGSRYTSFEDSINIIKKFLNTEFESGRHAIRIKQIEKLEKIQTLQEEI